MLPLLLTPQEVNDVVMALVAIPNHLHPPRVLLLQFIDHKFTSMLPGDMAPVFQYRADIGTMNQVQRLANGEVPLATYLNNAAMMVSGLVAEKVILDALNKVNQRSTGAPRLALDPAKLPEIEEVIVHTDDTVTLAFIQGAMKATPSVMKLQVPRFDDGQAMKGSNGDPVLYNGTGWLLSDSLIMTNHHVINARNEGEQPAKSKDIIKQSEGTRVLFDFDTEITDGSESSVIKLEASNADLDYAILRIPTVAGRTPLSLATKAIEKDNAVNIIQHPRGKFKRYAIRNNLVSATTATDVRYFTDTESGSSGSPVLNDQWEVVALHRGATYVTGVQFQGKSTAYINLGTQLSAILDDLKTTTPSLATEITA